MTNMLISYAKQTDFMIKNLSIQRTYSNYYFFNSRVLTHILFWVIYYISFSLIWSKNHGLYGSFFLEFILLPMRISATYLVIYWAMPKFLLKAKLIHFGVSLLLILILCGVFQRLSIYFFYEEFLSISKTSLFDIQGIFRSVLLINTTVMIAMTIKFYGIYQEITSINIINEGIQKGILKIKSERRTHFVELNNIIYIKGLGNYIVVTLNNGKELTSYITMKNVMGQLNNDFVRVHKSYIINKKHITSYNNEDIQIGINSIPRGKGINDDDLEH